MKTRSAAHDNLGNLLSESGQLDEAMRPRRRRQHRTRSQARSAILSNQSRLLSMLGEYSSAASRQDDALCLLEGTDANPEIWAKGLDLEAQHLERLGDLKQAIELQRDGRGAVSGDRGGGPCDERTDPGRDSSALGEEPAAAAAYRQAIALAEQVARQSIDEDLYRRGFLASLSHRLPVTDVAVQHILPPILKTRGRIDEAEANLIAAMQRGANRRII